MAKDRSGRVPFSIVAVVILVGSATFGAYMQQVAREAGERGGRSAGAEPEMVLPGLQAGLEAIAAECIDNAVDRQMEMDMDEGSQGLWSVDQNFRRYFDIQLKKEWGKRQYDRYCFTVEAGEATLQLGTYPMSIRAINRLGMAVNMTVPAGFRIAGSVNFTFTVGGTQKVIRKVDFGLDRASWYPLALFQANRLRRDCVNEGLLELLYKELLTGYMQKDFVLMLGARNMTRLVDPLNSITVGDLWKKQDLDGPGSNALDLALMIEEQCLFGGCRFGTLNTLINQTKRTLLDPGSAMTCPGGVFDGWRAFVDPANATGMALELAPFYGGITVLPLGGNGAGAGRFTFEVDSRWDNIPFPEFRKLAFAGEEELVDVYLLEVAVNGIWKMRVGPDRDHLLKLDIPVHLQFSVDLRINETNRTRAERGSMHCQIEDLELFDREYAGLYCTPVEVVLEITNSSGVPFQEMPMDCALDVSLDGDYLGTFRHGAAGPAGLVLRNVPSGPHEVTVSWRCPDGGLDEQTSAVFMFNNASEKLALTTGPQPDTSLFWTYALSYMRDTPARERLTRLVQFISLLAGYPVPGDIGAHPPGSSGYAQLMGVWLTGLDDSVAHLDAPQKSMDASRLKMISGAACVVKVLRESMKYVQKAVDAINEYEDRQGSLSPAEAGVRYTRGEAGESVSVRVGTGSGETGMTIGRPAGEGQWKSQNDLAPAGTKKTFSENQRLGIGAALDIGVAIMMVLSIHFKAAKYEATDGVTTQSERLDLTAELIKAIAHIAKVVIKYSVKLGMDAASKTAKACNGIVAGLGAFIGAIMVFQLIYDENVKFRGDPETVDALFTGFDSDTAAFYLALGGLAIGVLEIIVFLGKLSVVQPYLAPIAAALALIAVIVFMVLDWKAFSTVVSGTLTDDDRGKMADSIEKTLGETAGSVAGLNGYPADEEMLAARQARGAASLMSGIAALVPDRQMAFEMSNLSRYQYDMAWAREHQSRAVRSLRFFMVALWRQATEFGGRDWTWLHPLQEQTWDSSIYVTWEDGQRGIIEKGYVNTFLLGMNSSSIRNIKIEFELTGRVVVDRLGEWMDPMARIGDQVKVWGKRLAASRAMKGFLQGLDGTRYRNDWGYLQVRLSPTFTSCQLRVTGPEMFDFQDGRTGATASALVKTITGQEEAYRLYLEPGTYTLEFSGQTPELGLNLKNGRATVSVGDIYSPLFGQDPVNVMPEPDCIYFQIFNEHNGSARVRADVVDETGEVIDGLGTLFEFNNTTRQGGKEYINSRWVPGFCFDDSLWGPSDAQKRSLTYRIVFSVEMDDENDGLYERTVKKTVLLSDIRNDHVDRMHKDNGKFTDQLGYSLTILDEPVQYRTGVDEQGNDVYGCRYVIWKKID